MAWVHIIQETRGNGVDTWTDNLVAFSDAILATQLRDEMNTFLGMIAKDYFASEYDWQSIEQYKKLFPLAKWFSTNEYWSGLDFSAHYSILSMQVF